MNFLVSTNHAMVQQFGLTLAERGALECLATMGDLLGKADGSGAGLAVIDARTPEYEGDADLRRLKKINPKLKVLVVGQSLPPNLELAALAAGAMGCCDADVGQEQARRIFTIIEEGGVWISNAALPHLLQRLRVRSEKATALPDPVPVVQDAGLGGLTQREREIARMVATGESNKVIARSLNITERTVKAHLTTIFQKLRMHDRLQLALFVSKGGQ